MSNFTYPPPPPPPPPDTHSSPQPNQQGGRRIPTFHNSNSGRGRRPDSRGGNHRPHQQRFNGQHNVSSSGGIPVAMNPHFPAAYSSPNYPQAGYHGAGQHYSSHAAASWSMPQPHTYPTAPSPAASMPYSNQYSTPSASLQSAQGYGPGPVPHSTYNPQYTGYPAALGSAYPVATQVHATPSAVPPRGHVASGQQAFRDQNTGPHHLHQNKKFADQKSGSRDNHNHGQKRKREQSPHRAHGKSSQASPISLSSGTAKSSSGSVVKPKVLTAPPVPSFGFHALPPRPPPVASITGPESKDQKDRKKQKKRKTNQLGLTPKGDVHNVTDEEVDEEAAFVNSGAPQVIEFRGRTVSLSTSAEIKAWIEERKRRFPTAARIAERKVLQEARKKQADEKRKQRAEERQKSVHQKANEKKSSKKAKSKNKKEIEGQSEAKSIVSSVTPSKEELQRRKLEKHLRKAEKLRSMLEQSDIKDEQPSGGKSEEAAEHSSSSSESSSNDHSDSDEDAGPDVETIKGRPTAADTSPNKNHAVKESRSNFTSVPCKYFVRDGHCRRKHCRFSHSLPLAADKQTLFDRLKEQEMHQESTQILDIIKQLGDNGQLDPPRS